MRNKLALPNAIRPSAWLWSGLSVWKVTTLRSMVY